MSIIFRRFTAFCLSLMIVVSSTQSAYAATSIGGWSLTDSIIAGANTTIEAVRTSGDKVLKSSITVGASASKLGKHLIKGGGQVALAYAVVELIGEGVDWVLDPENNRIKYTVPPMALDGNSICRHARGYNQTPNEFCATFSKPFYAVIDTGRVQCGSEGQVSTYADLICAKSTTTQKYIPIDTVAQKVISNASAGHAPSQDAVKAVALEGFAAGEYDSELDAAATDSATDNPPDTDNPPVTDPAAPVDLSPLLAALNAIKAVISSVLDFLSDSYDWWVDKWTDFIASFAELKEWLMAKPEPDSGSNELDIPIPDSPTPSTDINFNASCPPNFEFKGSIFGNPINIVLLDTAMFCDFLATYVKYPVYAASSLYALYIVGGRKDV